MTDERAIEWLSILYRSQSCKSDVSTACDVGIDAIKDRQELNKKIELIKSKYEDIQNGAASDATLGWNRAIDMVLEILES
jgi:hypothetical protein